MDFFSSMDEFRQNVPGVDATLEEVTITPSFLVAKSKIIDAISDSVYNAVNSGSNEALKNFVELALANYTMYEYKIFESVAKNGGDGALYKYQLEDIREKHLNMFWTAMDNLMSSLDAIEPAAKGSEPNLGNTWRATSQFTERQKLPIKTAKEFSYYFSINNSGYFFSKLLFLIREIYEDNIISRIGVITGSTSPKMKNKALRALCYHVMSRAVELFDVTELPESIRKDIAHEYTKSPSQAPDRERLAEKLKNKAEEYYLDLEREQRSDQGIRETVVNNNDPQDKFYSLT